MASQLQEALRLVKEPTQTVAVSGSVGRLSSEGRRRW